MNKTISILAIALSVTQICFSQGNMGFKAGINSSNQVFNEHANTSFGPKSIIGWQAGFFVKPKLSSHLTLGIEANLSSVGARHNYLALSPLSTEQIIEKTKRVAYLELPFTLQYSIGKVYFGAGPGVSIKLSNSNNESEMPPAVKTLDFAANGLVGLNITNRIGINARYSHGLTNVTKNGSYYGNGVTLKNRVFSASILYTIK